jgi:hypothetical protein
MYGPSQQNPWFNNPYYSSLGIEEFLNPDQERLREEELRMLSGRVNSGMKNKDAQALMAMLTLMRGMPNEDLLTLLALLNPDIQKSLAEAMGQTAFREGGAAPNVPVGTSNNFSAPRSSGGATGGPSGATGAAPSGPAPGGTPAGQNLARVAEQTANSLGSVGWCYKGVSQAVAKAMPGVNLSGASAYMAADQLAASSKFKEVKVSPEELKKLPPGAIVVWGKTGASPHGHISVALGDGREASDHIQQQMTSLRGATNFRVFMPV